MVQGDAAQVDVVVGLGTAGQDDLAADHGEFLDEFQQAGTGGSGVGCKVRGGSHGFKFSAWRFVTDAATALPAVSRHAVQTPGACSGRGPKAMRRGMSLPDRRNLPGDKRQDGRRPGPPAGEQRNEHYPVHDALDSLNHHGGHPPPPLHGFEILACHLPPEEGRGKPGRCGHSVLDGQVDAHAPGRATSHGRRPRCTAARPRTSAAAGPAARPASGGHPANGWRPRGPPGRDAGPPTRSRNRSTPSLRIRASEPFGPR